MKLLRFSGVMSKINLQGGLSTAYSCGYGIRPLLLQGYNFEKREGVYTVCANGQVVDEITPIPPTINASASIHCAQIWKLPDEINDAVTNETQGWQYYNAKDSSFYYLKETLDTSEFQDADDSEEIKILKRVLTDAGTADITQLRYLNAYNIYGLWFYGHGTLKE
jgi:hypothetical protein